MHGQIKTLPKGWLAFDLNVLRRFKFTSVLFPFTETPAAASYVKRWNAAVTVNDPLRSNWVRNYATIANSGQTLTEAEVTTVLEDAYVPGYKLRNPALANWFSEVDAWWFDNVRENIDRVESDMAKAIASSLVFEVGEYALSFKGEARELRQPLSQTYRRLWSIWRAGYDNGQRNSAEQKTPDDLIAETPSDLMFLRLPAAHSQGVRTSLGRNAWHEEWFRGRGDVWEEVDFAMSGKLGSPTETKSQYLHLLEQTLTRASHIRNWAVAHVETGFITTQDVVDTISNIRRVDTIYTKDFSELTGAKAVIIAA